MDLYSATKNDDGTVMIVSTITQTDPDGVVYKQVVDRDARSVEEVQTEIDNIMNRITSEQQRITELQEIIDTKKTVVSSNDPIGEPVLLAKG